MPPDISSHVSRIEKTATKLNKVADELTAQLKLIDEAVSKTGLGVEYYDDTAFATGRESGLDAEYKLAFDRADGGSMGIVVVAKVYPVDENGESLTDEFGYTVTRIEWTRPVHGVSRALRIKAASRLSEFLRCLAHAAETELESATKHLADAESLTAELRAIQLK